MRLLQGAMSMHNNLNYAYYICLKKLIFIQYFTKKSKERKIKNFSFSYHDQECLIYRDKKQYNKTFYLKK